MAGYTRQSSATIIAGANVTAAIFNAEFNQLQSAFNGTTGHGHTGGTGDGPKLVLTAAASISGILPLANGGTGYSTRIDAYDNLHIVASDITVGSTVDLSTSDGDYIEITGTGGTVTSFGTCDIGVKRTLYFSGASNTITHNGTSLICPNGVNITVKAGEQLVVRSLGSGNWIVELLMKNSNAALGNLVLAADKLPYMSSTTAMSLADLTTFGRSLIDDTDAATARSTLGLGTISTQSAGTVTITGGSITGITDLAVADGGTGSSTASGARTNLGVAIGTDVQAYDAGLAALAAFNTNGFIAQTADNTFAGRTITGTANKITVTNGDGISGDPTITIPDAVTLVTPTVTGTLTAQALVDISGASAGQIKFPATQNASSNANTLDDYEEGTWTPTYAMTGVDFTSVTYSQNAGFYTKIGNTVFATWIMVTSAVTKGSASGNLTITGLPFSSSGTHFGGYISFAYNWLVSAPDGALTASAAINLYKRTTSDGSMNNMAVTDVGTGVSANQLRGTVIYTI